MAALPSPFASASDQGSLASGDRGSAHVSIKEAPAQAATAPLPLAQQQQQAPGFLPHRQPVNATAPAPTPAPDPDLLALQQMWSQDIDLIMHEDDVKKLLVDLEASERLLPPLRPCAAVDPCRKAGGAAVPVPYGRHPAQCVQPQQAWLQPQAADQVAMQGPWTEGVGASRAAGAASLQRYASAPVPNSYSGFGP